MKRYKRVSDAVRAAVKDSELFLLYDYSSHATNAGLRRVNDWRFYLTPNQRVSYNKNYRMVEI